MAVAELEVRITGNTGDLTGAFNKASSSAQTFGTKMQSVGKSMSNVGRTMTLGVTLPIVAGFKKALDAAGEAEKAMAQTNAVIKSTGGAAGVTAKEVVKMADGFAKTTLFQDDAIQSAENLLLTFTKVGSDVFPQATKSILDMSQAMGQDLESTTVQVGKALNDPIKGLTALSRVGVAFTADQKKMIKGMVEAGDIMGAQKIILAELATEFGGAAQAAASTEWGKGQQAMKRIGEVMEDIGTSAAPMVAEVMEKLADKAEAVAKWFDNLSPAGKKIATNLIAMTAAAGPALFVFGKLTTVLGGIAKLSGFARVASGVGGIGAAAGTATPAIASMSGALGVFQAAVAGVAIGTAIQQGIIQPMLEAKWAAEDVQLAWESNIGTFDKIAKFAPEIASGMHAVTTELERMKLNGDLSAEAMSRVFNADNIALMRDAAEAGANMTLVTQGIAGGMTDAAVNAGLASGAFAATAVSLAQVSDKAGNVTTAVQQADGKIKILIETADGVKEVTFDPLIMSAEELAAAVGLPVDQVQALIDKLNAVPKKIGVTITVSQIMNAPIVGSNPSSQDVNSDGTLGSAGILDGAKAIGGPVSARKTYLVGEKGPEIFVPNSSGEIIPNHRIGSTGGRPMGGDGASIGPVYITIDGSQDARQVAIEVREELIRMGRRGSTPLEFVG